MSTLQPSWIAEFAQALRTTSPAAPSAAGNAWEVFEDPASAVLFVRMGERSYRLVRFHSLDLGFTLGVLGAQYERDCLDRSWPAALTTVLCREKGRARYHLVCYRTADRLAPPFPLLTLLEDQRGNFHVLEVSPHCDDRFWALLTVAFHVLAEREDDAGRIDEYGDFQILGVPSIVQRHSTERLRKHISHKVIFDRHQCTHCLRCVTACNEMRASMTEQGVRLLGPSEDFCTNCGLCQKRCSFLTAQPKEQLRRSVDPTLQVNAGGAGIALYGEAAALFVSLADRRVGGALPWFPYEAARVFSAVGEGAHPFPIEHQVRLELSTAAPIPRCRRPLLLTAPAGNGSGRAALLVRSLYRAAVVLQTSSGRTERSMAFAAMGLGLQVTAVAPLTATDLSFPVNETVRLFHRAGLFRQESLVDLWQRRAADLFLAPYTGAIPEELHRRVLEDTGRQIQILAPHIRQALPVTKNPLLGELNSELTRIFAEQPELIEAEARVAQQLLADLPRNHALIHARYRPLAIASGHSACPTCAEAQVMAVPVYMAMAMSLARREIPQVSFTMETGCMSETLHKVGEVAQKVPGGRSVFGGGFAFGEAIALAQDHATRLGNLPKQRRYVVSQGGDGGSVIGLPAWLNALRQQAYLVRQRFSNVLHFINITDTQVYSNTGGESSASSLLGMGTLTTPVGKFLLGNQKVQWTLINLAAEFAGVLVGVGHSADRLAMQEFWQLADQLGQSAIRWDVTPCPETGKFFGEDPDDLAEVMANAGMLPELVFVGRMRKRIAPYHPEDRGKPFAEWRRQPKPIMYWLARDPRYRALIQRNPQSGKFEARNLACHFLISQLESFRDQLNWQIDLETRIVVQAEESVRVFFGELQENWSRYRFRLDQFPFAVLYNREGQLKPEYRVSLEQEMVRRVLGCDEVLRYALARERLAETHQEILHDILGALSHLETKTARLEAASGMAEQGWADTLERIENLQEALQDEFRNLEKALPAGVRTDPVESEIFHAAAPPAEGLPEERRRHLHEVLNRILDERGLAKQTELNQYRLSQQLKKGFLEGGGLIRAQHTVASTLDRRRLRDRVEAFGPFTLGVASLAGDRGIAINRILAHFFTAKGAWAGMAWQFGSSKRGTPVLSATFVDCKPLHRKDAMHSFPMVVLVVTNFEEMKRQPDLFFAQLHPHGILIINQRRPPEELWQELVGGYPQEIREPLEALCAEWGKGGRSPEALQGGEVCAITDTSAALEGIADRLYGKPSARLNPEQLRTVRKVSAILGVRLASVDMDGIIERVSGSANIVSNLVAVGPIFRALVDLGFPFVWERDLKTLSQGFPEAVLKNPKLLQQYYAAMADARDRAQFWNPILGLEAWAAPGNPPQAQGALSATATDFEGAASGADPGEYLMIMGGTLAGMVLSQIAIAEHPLFYIGFPITPAGNPFYAMAEAFANGHPYIVVDEVNPSEKVAAEKLIGIARAGGFLPVTFTASQGWRLFTEIMPQFVGARLEGLFLIAKRALAAPNLNIEESHTDFMSFRDDGGIMLAPKGIQEYVPALYLARLLTHFAKMPVIVSIGGITDTHKIGLVKVPPDDRVRSWLRTTLKEFDYLEHKLVNRQGDIVVHGPSGTSAVYQESQSEIEKAHRAAAAIAPYAVRAVHELTGVWLDELEAAVQRVSPGGEAVPGSAETVMILQGSLYPNAVEALRELEEDGWTGMGCLSVRTFNPFPEERLFPWFEGARRLVVLDRSNSFGSVPPLAARIFASLARWQAKVGRSAPLSLRTLVGGLGGREITVREMKEILLSTHLLFHRAEEWEPPLIAAWLAEDTVLQGLVNEAAALEVHNTNRHTRVPRHLRAPAAERDEYGERVASLGRELTAKNYATLLANYHHVEFVAPREFLEETALLQQLVLYVEVRLARHAAGSGRGSRRHGQILCHYSQDPRDQEMAAGLLQQQPILPASGVVVMPVGEVAGQAGAPPAALPQTSGALESGAPPAVVSFDAREAERIVTILSELVVLHGEEPLYYNPEDFEHELLRRLQNAPDSPLHRLSERLPGPQADDLLWGYRCCYRDLIDHTLQREILTQHHAPELRELFYEEGRARLVALARHFAVHLQEVEPAAAAKIVQGELERYLNERILPHYPKHALFYLEYFRNWVAPGVLAEHRH